MKIPLEFSMNTTGISSIESRSASHFASLSTKEVDMTVPGRFDEPYPSA
jgi:hypothetical protein